MLPYSTNWPQGERAHTFTPWQIAPLILPLCVIQSRLIAIMTKMGYVQKMNRSDGKGIAVENVANFWEKITASPSRFLGLDYDGTLAPFHANPMQAKPLPGLISILRSLLRREDTSLAIISGRPAAEILMLLDNLPVTIIGSHGFERWDPAKGASVILSPSTVQKQGLAEAKRVAEQLAYADRLEHKVASIAMHTRGVPASLAAAMETNIFKAWSTLAPPYALECRRFNGGIEIRCSGRHKGDALLELLKDEPPGTLPVYVGDDETDEDAFAVVQHQGIGIKVGANSSETAAVGFLKDCSAVKIFLETWLSVTSTTEG